MKTVMTKTLLAATLMAAMGIGSSSAMATLFNPFTITETSVGAPTVANVITNAGKLTGNYTEVGTFTSASPCGVDLVCGSFSASILWNAGQVVATDGSTVLVSQIGPTGSLSSNDYGLFAFVQADGTYQTNTLTGKTVSTAGPGGSLSLYIDPSTNDLFTAPANGTLAWTASNTADDYLIGTGATVSGQGTLDPSLPTCTGGINCGSFGQTDTFTLTAAGDPGTGPGSENGVAYFTYPVPFYNLVFSSGQFDNFSPTGTQTIVGSLDASFGRVPEPGSLALLGIGLLGMVGMLSRGRKQA